MADGCRPSTAVEMLLIAAALPQVEGVEVAELAEHQHGYAFLASRSSGSALTVAGYADDWRHPNSLGTDDRAAGSGAQDHRHACRYTGCLYSTR